MCTPAILDVLGRYEAQAVFFFLGRNIAQCPEVTADVAAKGHVVGNHTKNHPHLREIDDRTIIEEITETSEMIRGATGTVPSLFRAPWGESSDAIQDLIEHEAGLMSFDWWDAQCGEEFSATGDHIADRILERLREATFPDPVVLMHDGEPGEDRSAIPEALEIILSTLAADGCSFPLPGAGFRYKGR